MSSSRRSSRILLVRPRDTLVLLKWFSQDNLSDEDIEARQSLRGFVATASVLFTTLAISVLAQSDLGGTGRMLGGYPALWPQRWSFFVELDTDLLDGYRVTPGAARMTSVHEPHRNSSLFGLDRGSYQLSSEVREIALRVPDRYWQTCDRTDPTDCGAELNTSLVFGLKPLASEPALCGLLVVDVYRVKVPAPHELPDSSGRAHRFAVVDVACSP